MRQSGHTGHGHPCGGDGAAYVLGALEPAESAGFERHLSECETCREEIAGLASVADALALAAPQFAAPQFAAPRGLRRKVLATARSRPADGRARRRRWAGSPVALAGAESALAAAVVLGILVATGGAPGSRLLRATVLNSPGTAAVRVSDGQAQLSVRHFPPPPSGSIYEVWLRNGNRPLTPTDTLFTVNADGAANTGIPASLRGFDEILVTVEPAAGSRKPTHSPVIEARLG